MVRLLSTGRMIHYVAPGSADGKYPKAHRAAIVALNERDADGNQLPTLCVINPTGIHFASRVPFDPSGTLPYSWHWPEFVEDNPDAKE